MSEIEIYIESSGKSVPLYGSLFSVNSSILVILISGSGAQDRYESIASQEPFKVLSMGFNEHGFDTFCWDDRGTGKSEGDYYASNSTETINDSKNVLKFFRKNYQYKKIVLLGHSQGTLIASRVALECGADLLILCAGIIRDGKLALLDQHRKICLSDQWEPQEIESTLKEKEAIFDLLIDYELNEPDKSTTKLEDKLWDHFLNGTKKEQLNIKDHQLLKEIIEDLCEWEWRYILTEKSSGIIEQISIPVLAIFGEKDIQVDSKKEILFLKKLALKHVTVQSLKNHNHLFQDNCAGNLDEYSELGEAFSKKSIAAITSWLENYC